MKKLLTLFLIIFTAFVLIAVVSCKKKESACTPPATPTLWSNSPVEYYDTIYLRADTNGMNSLTFYWTGPDGFSAYGPYTRIAPATVAKAGDYTLTITDPKTWCVSTPATITVTLKTPEPCPGTPTVDYSGKTYNTIQVGSQCWLKENLSVGVLIQSTSFSYSHSDDSNNGRIEKYCFNNDTTFCNTYGGLYDWNEMQQYNISQGIQGICPAGWHIPSTIDWKTLLGSIKDGNVMAGTKLKAGGSLGFEALLSGFRYPTGSFYSVGDYGDFWSSTTDGKMAWHLKLWSGFATASIVESDKNFGFSVRCLKD